MIRFNDQLKSTSVQHGGNLDTAIKKYGFDKNQWMDLSTGISPWCWPVKNLPEQVWNALPPPLDNLLTAASQYYDIDSNKIIATPGSQIAIRFLPQLFKPSTVAVPTLGYQEHAASWQLANHKVTRYRNINELVHLLDSRQVEHVVVINPNNPSGEMVNVKIMNDIAAQTSGIMIIDEAFIDLYENAPSTKQNDTTPRSTIKNLTGNMVVLRSVGKFFGLAGLRLGFAVSNHPTVTQLNTLLQPWSISHASITIGSQALSDKTWQQEQYQRIQSQTKAFLPTLEKIISNELKTSTQKDYDIRSCGLFNTILIDKASGPDTLTKLHQKLAQSAIWTRLFNHNDEPAWLRFSLPADIQELEQRLAIR